MSRRHPDGPLPMTEQRRAYAELLDVLVRIGMVLVVATFAPYATGLLRPSIPLSELPALWGLPLSEYLERTGARPGLWWLTMLGRADFLPLAGVAFLASATIACYVRIIPIFGRSRNVPYLVIALLQVVVLLLAASGLFSSG
jgi:hypothetical protein